MKKLTSIDHFEEGATIQGFYLCTEKHLRHTRGGDTYLDLVLRDRTGQVAAKIWDKVDELSEKFAAGDPVAVDGYVDSFLDRLQLVIRKINRASVQHYGRYGYDPALILPTSPRDPDKMWGECMDLLNRIVAKPLKQLVRVLYQEHKERILVHPASVMMHHNYRHGFLEHVVSMAQMGVHLAKQYGLDSDWVLAGVFLHDIGKLREISSELEAEYTPDGHFLGHIVIGRDMVRDAIQAHSISLPEDTQTKLEHIILAHQGRYEWHSPKQPVFPEALLVHLMDNLDAKMNLMERALREDLEAGEWTDRRNYFRMALYKGDDAESE